MKSPYHSLEAEEAATYIAEGALTIVEQTWTAEEIEGHKRHFAEMKNKAEAKKRRTQSDAEQDNQEAIAQRVAALIQNAPQQAAPQQLLPRRREMISSAGV